ncbi:anti-phage ZorAB system protein ZorA [Psychrobacter sp. DAB_AL62B]|uniref:anti-phage ZorAB system protein ZorA n=1 Tax=Psychrobacter sp. DAB_AL62B TaxID=1028420 RepID=UPI002381013B|nr:anti-phage ZorAB system protein ZorA [Psychrobacter sp. DAB_AL62B]MDE4456126.1 methyl-accepting chemotaxis protein [Psychrobacter sp. DAB_AL62B]
MDLLALAQFSQEFFILPATMFFFVVIIGFTFYFNYTKPAKLLKIRLSKLANSLEGLDKKAKTDKDLLDASFTDDPVLSQAWLNYKQTLHDIHEVIDGESVIEHSRATVPSEVFFTESIVVDIPLKVDFYKHLPGIITGIGIIATFIGLLSGLLAFDPAGNPDKVQDSLDLLLNGVAEAFMASALAIFAAMVITFFEKSWLRKCYEQLQRLNTAIDNTFTADESGEEYLAKLLKSSQANEANARQLKDSLVNELKVMMTNLVAENKRNQGDFASQLSDSYAQTSQSMATQIGESITDNLQGPLEQIASSVQKVSGDQGSAVQELMTDVLAAFMSKLETTFGGQMTGMSEMMTQSVTAMREMQAGFSQLMTDMQTNSEVSTKTLETQMAKMMEDIHQKQNEMSTQMNEMVENLSAGSAKIGDQGLHAVEQLNSKVSDLVSGLGTSMSGLLSNVAEQRIEQDRQISDNQQKLHEQSSVLIDNLGSEIKELITHSKEAVQTHKESIQKLSQVTTDSITGMNSGAERMRLAAEQFTTAGSSLSTVTGKTSELIAQVNTTSTNMTSASSSLIELIRDYKNSQNSVNTAIEALENIIQQSKSEAGMTSQMLNDMQNMTTALSQVKREMQEYLAEVSDVLVKSFDSFGTSVESSLNQSLVSFDNTLNQAVQRLATGVEGLGNVVEDLEDLTQRTRR